MIKTKFPHERVDFEKYYKLYMEREDAVTELPTEAELKEIARIGLIKDHMVLTEIPEKEVAQLGDTLSIRTESKLPKFNKEKVTISIGRGLYDKELETMAAGKRKGDCYELNIKEEPVKVTLLEIKRKQEPKEVTDEMVVELQLKDNEQKPILTVADYEKYIANEKVVEILATMNYYIMEPLLKDYPVENCDEEDLKILKRLEADYFRKIYKEQECVDVDSLTVEEAQEKWKCDSFDAFLTLREDWYKMKVQQCLILRNILGVEDDPKYDYTTRYEVLSDLTMLMFDKLKERINGGK